MPRVALTPLQKVRGEIRAADRNVLRWLAENKVGKGYIASLLEVTPRAVQSQFERGSVSREVCECVRLLSEGKLPMP